MSFRSKLKIDNVGMFVALLFYAVVGIISFAALPMAGFPPHIGIIGILSLLTAYGLFRKRAWTIWFVVILFLTATTFSVITLYYYLGTDLILDISMIAYLVLTWVFTSYIADKRKTLEG
jgi:small-conductance mechanosensitive channel